MLYSINTATGAKQNIKLYFYKKQFILYQTSIKIRRLHKTDFVLAQNAAQQCWAYCNEINDLIAV